MPIAGAENLLGTCRKYGVTIRGFFEAGILVAVENESDPELYPLQLQMWEAARTLESDPAFRGAGVRRMRFHIEFDDDIHHLIQHRCALHGVSISATLARFVMPWPPGHGPSADHRRQTLERIVCLARERDFDRRHLTVADRS